MYDCNKLKNGKYYDEIKIKVGERYGSSEEIVFGYKVVCDASKLGAFDLNFVVLFAIAIGIIVLAIKTPPLLIFNDMTDEERQ
jgi:hypothetical protein